MVATNRTAPFLPERGKILEIGCAFGDFLEIARSLGYSAEGVEPSPAAEEAAHRGFEIHRGSFESSRLLERSYDAIFMIDVLEHLARPDLCVRKCRSLLREPGGVVIAVTPNFGTLWCGLLGHRWPYYLREHLYYFSRQSLSKLFLKEGFKPLSIGKAVKGTSLRYLAGLGMVHGILTRSTGTFLSALPLASSVFRWPADLFCICQVSEPCQLPS